MYTQLPLNLPTNRYRADLADAANFRETADVRTYRATCAICLCQMPRRTADDMCDACRALDVPAPTPTVQEGTYTIEYPNGEHFTFRIRTPERGSLAGKLIVEYLAGPDNTTDFAGFGFVNPDGSVAVWGRFRGGPMDRKAHHIKNIFQNGAAEESGMAYAMRSGRCRRCNRELTVPASIHRGFGPDCATKV